MGTDVISMVLPGGSSFLALRKVDMKSHELQLDLTKYTDTVAPKLMGGDLSNFFITIFI
jgi:hypothetical protein